MYLHITHNTQSFPIFTFSREIIIDLSNYHVLDSFKDEVKQLNGKLNFISKAPLINVPDTCVIYCGINVYVPIKPDNLLSMLKRYTNLIIYSIFLMPCLYQKFGHSNLSTQDLLL